MTALKEAAAETDEPDRAIVGLLEAGEVLEGPANDSAGAGAAYEAVLAIAPDREQAVVALERLYVREKRWGDLAALLERRADRLPAAEAAALHHRRVEILVDHLDALGQAADLLETLAAAGDRAALAKLEQIYRRAERHDDYLATLGRLADGAGSQPERITALRRLAAEAEALPEGEERALRALDEILRLDPRDADAFEALNRLSRAERRFATLAEALSRRLEVTETADARRDLLLSLARLYETELGDPERALETYVAAKSAGDRREEIHEATARLAERLAPLGALRGGAARVGRRRAGDGAAGRGAGRGGARLHRPSERRRGGGGGAGARGGAGPRAPARAGHPGARPRGERRRSIRRWRSTSGQPRKEPDRSEQSALFTRAAVVLLERGKDEDRAADLLVRALAADPGHRNANERLVDVYTRREQWADVEALLDRELEEEREEETDAARRRSTGRARDAAGARLHSRSGNPTRRSAAWRARTPAPRAPADAAHVRRFPLRARANGRRRSTLYESLLGLHRAALPAAELPDMFQRIGRARAELGDADGAIAAYREVRALAPEPAPRHRGALGAAGGQGGLARLGRRSARRWPPSLPTAREPSGRRSATPARRRLDDRPRAEAAYRQALEAEPARRSTIEKLLAIFKEGQPPRSRRSRCSRRWPRWRPAAATRARLRREAARLLLDKVNRPLEAVELLEHSLDDAPEMIDAFDELARLREDATDWAGLVAEPPGDARAPAARRARARCGCGSGRGWGTWRCASCAIASWP